MLRWIPFILLTLFIQVCHADSETWPQRVSFPSDIMVKIVKEAPGTEASIYLTNHFELISDMPLSRSALCQILEVMEATLASLKALPLGLNIPPQENRYVVRLVTHENDFIDEGGIRGAGGIYIPASQQTLIRIDSLQPKFSPDGRIATVHRCGIIAHEVTHQLQHHLLQTLPTWLVEGMAVYLESVPYYAGTFQFDQADFTSAEGIRRCTTKHYQMIPLDELMKMSRTDWNHHFVSSPIDQDRYYLSAYLLTYYFMHLTETEDGALLRDFIIACQQANNGPERDAALQQLATGADFEQLQSALTLSYAEKGFTITPLLGYSLAAIE